MLLDIIGLFGAFSISHLLRFQTIINPLSTALWLLIIGSALCLYVMDAYTIRRSRGTWKFFIDCLAAMIGVGLTSVVLIYLVGVEQFTPVFGRGVLSIAIVLFLIWALIWRWIISEWVLRSIGIKYWLVISDRKAFQELEQSNSELAPSLKLTHLDSAEDSQLLNQWLESHPQQSEVVFQENVVTNTKYETALKAVVKSGVSTISITEFYEQYWQKTPISSFDVDWLTRNINSNLFNDRVGTRLKRIVDFLFGSIGLIVTLPVLLLSALIVRLSSSGKVIYKQQRVGLHGKIFTLYKFRSMVDDAEKVGPQWSEENDPRVTTFGRIMRATRIDELPQLLNLVIGNMSLIGPRPERPEFVNPLKNKIPLFEMREKVVPGLTGWAQVKYPYGSSVKDSYRKLEYDLFYIKHRSIRMDIAILLKTCMVVILGKGR